MLLKGGLLDEEEYDKLVSSDTVVFSEENFSKFKERLKNKSNNTAKAYMTSVAKIAEKLGYRNGRMEVGANEIEKFLKELVSEGYTYGSIRRYKSSLAYYHESVENSRSVVRDIDLSSIQSDGSDNYFFREDEIYSIANSCDLRSKLMIRLLFETGARRQEMIDLKKQHIDYSDNSLKVNYGQKDERTLYFSEETKSLIIKYIEEWKDEVEDINYKRKIKESKTGTKQSYVAVSDYLFQTIRAEQISYSTLYKILKDCSFYYFYSREIKNKNKNEAMIRAEKLSSSFHTESIRNSRIADLISKGVTNEKIQIIMGIKNSWEVKKFGKASQQLYPERFRL